MCIVCIVCVVCGRGLGGKGRKGRRGVNSYKFIFGIEKGGTNADLRTGVGCGLWEGSYFLEKMKKKKRKKKKTKNKNIRLIMSPG